MREMEICSNGNNGHIISMLKQLSCWLDDMHGRYEAGLIT